MMKKWRALVTIMLMVAILAWTVQPLRTQARPLPSPAMPRAAADGPSGQTLALADIVSKSYLEVLNLATTVTVSPQEVEAYRTQLKKEEDAKLAAIKQDVENLKQQTNAAKKKLDELNKRGSRDDAETAKERQDTHCQIQQLRKQLVKKEAIDRKSTEVNYDNKEAKLDLLARWPTEKKRIDGVIEAGKARQRPYGDVEDIGVRDVGKGQEKDIKVGEEASKELKSMGLMPPEFKDEEIEKYVQNLAEYIAKNSDLRVPVKTHILLTDEINAFALPGGFLYVNTGLIQEADTESELAGVMAHEIAHAAARHNHRLQTKATIAGILLQAAQIGAYIATGGLVSLLSYYLLQYGFAGLGLLIDLKLLGVSREFEMEADQLGAQYLWKSGYDPRAFITFFDKMASKEGYARNTSFFRTHPAFAERILHSIEEFAYLPPKEEYMTDSTEFHQIKTRLQKLSKDALDKEKLEAKKRPRLERDPCPEDKDQPKDQDKPQLKKPDSSGAAIPNPPGRDHIGCSGTTL